MTTTTTNELTGINDMEQAARKLCSKQLLESKNVLLDVFWATNNSMCKQLLDASLTWSQRSASEVAQLRRCADSAPLMDVFVLLFQLQTNKPFKRFVQARCPVSIWQWFDPFLEQALVDLVLGSGNWTNSRVPVLSERRFRSVFHFVCEMMCAYAMR
jgi:hypothetical protein